MLIYLLQSFNRHFKFFDIFSQSIEICCFDYGCTDVSMWYIFLRVCNFPLPGQGPSLQMSWATEGPGQGDPPCSGAGLSHSLSLDLCPSPQVILHGFHGNQLPQSPSTDEKDTYIICLSWNLIQWFSNIQSIQRPADSVEIRKAHWQHFDDYIIIEKAHGTLILKVHITLMITLQQTYREHIALWWYITTNI